MGFITEHAADWTRKGGRSNSSDEFEDIVSHVEGLISDSAHDLIHGRHNAVARLIVAQLAHTFHMVPLHDT